LLAPYGELLYQLGPFRITKGVLLAGLRRGITLEGLIMLSKAGIRQDLKLPGYIGELLGESFRLFGLLTEKKIAFKKKLIQRKESIFAILDELLFELSNTGIAPEPVTGAYMGRDSPPGCQAPEKTDVSLMGFIILVAVLILSWLPFFFSLS
jgi:heptaprenyl diphosphate synthase